MKKYIEIDVEVLRALESGKSVEGSVKRDKQSGKLVFRAYNRLSRQRNYVADKLLYESVNGWLRESAKRLKMRISLKKSSGQKACAVAFLQETREIAEFLYNLEEE